MDKTELRAAAEKYRQEMMELYGKKQTDAPSVNSVGSTHASKGSTDINASKEKADTPVREAQKDTEENSEKKDMSSDRENGENDERSEDGGQAAEEEYDIEKRFPPPVLPDFIKAASSPQPIEDAFGYLKVRVLTGGGGIPVGGNPVIVSRSTDKGEDLVSMLMTDQSGDTRVLQLPTYRNPNGTEPNDYRAASEYNISVGSEGYFSEESRGVSIFDGVTSIQTFNLVPEPYDYTTDDTVIHDNPEPEVTA